MRLNTQDEKDRRITFSLDGELCFGYAGDTIASALYAESKRTWRRSKTGQQQGMLCGMGVCFECQVRVNGIMGIRACQMEIQEGMLIETSMKDENQR